MRKRDKERIDAQENARMVWESLPLEDREWALRHADSVIQRLRQEGVIE